MTELVEAPGKVIELLNTCIHKAAYLIPSLDLSSCSFQISKLPLYLRNPNC